MTAASPRARAWVSFVPHTPRRPPFLTFYHVRAVAFLLFSRAFAVLLLVIVFVSQFFTIFRLRFRRCFAIAFPYRNALAITKTYSPVYLEFYLDPYARPLLASVRFARFQVMPY